MKNVNFFARVALACLLLTPLSCAVEPDGSFVIDEQTVEEAWDTKSLAPQPPLPDAAAGLSLNRNQPVQKASIPPPPPGFTRVYGTLDSVGLYETKAAGAGDFPGARARGSTFQNSVFGMLGPAANGGTAWFYADINPADGAISGARVYLNGFRDGVCDMRRPVEGGYGFAGKSGFSLRVSGPCYFENQSGTTADYAILVSAAVDPAGRPAGYRFTGRYIVDDTGKINRVPANPADVAAVYDYGEAFCAVARR